MCREGNCSNGKPLVPRDKGGFNRGTNKGTKVLPVVSMPTQMVKSEI